MRTIGLGHAVEMIPNGGVVSLNPGRNVALVWIFWLFVALSAVALVLGWSLEHEPIDPVARADLSDLLISFGLSAAALLLARLFLGASLYLYCTYRTRTGPYSGHELAGF